MALPLKILLVTLGAVIVVVLLVWLGQRRLVYFPTGSPGPPPTGWTEMVARASDGVDLAGWYQPGPPDEPVVVVFHGNAGNRADRLPLGTRLNDLGFGVLLTDYRGYGGNSGSPSEAGLRLDAEAFLAWISEVEPDRSVILFGESLGGAVAVGAAAGSEVAAVVLRSPFTSLADVASVHYPVIPADLLLADEWPVEAEIGTVTEPTSVIAGPDDGTVPLEQSRAVFDAAENPFDWVVVEGADHNDAALAYGPEVIDAVARIASAVHGA